MTPDASWDALAEKIRRDGPTGHLTEEEVSLVYSAPTLVGLPDGRGSHLVHVMDGQWLTQRVRAPRPAVVMTSGSPPHWRPW